ncbi:hypothetical protein [Pseudomonas sp. EMN2]|uniref:hypothetical protein n=1 Tax=Pseudomonas sp. EMN2 TaxID=2615212 RepID=UPI00129BF0BC|nr:hypothetical protein [Pseudomonas sp. EMN2]
MDDQGKAAAIIDDAEKALDELRLNASRWRFYSAKVAAILNISIEEFEREVDGAMAAQGKADE